MSITTFISSVADIVSSIIDSVVEFLSILGHIIPFSSYLFESISRLPSPFSGFLGLCYVVTIVVLIGSIFGILVKVLTAGVGGSD